MKVRVLACLGALHCTYHMQISHIEISYFPVDLFMTHFVTKGRSVLSTVVTPQLAGHWAQQRIVFHLHMLGITSRSHGCHSLPWKDARAGH